MADSTRAIDIYKHLKTAGFDVYFPAQKRGDCKDPYVVVREADTNQYMEFSSTVTMYDILCYVPRDLYSRLRVYAEEVKASMSQLKPMLTQTGYESAPFFDGTVNAHMMYIQYRNLRYIPK